MLILKYLIFLGIIGVTGCSGIVADVSVGYAGNTRVVGEVTQPHFFRSGCCIVIEPFRAGVGVAASDEFDRLSLIVLRGIMDGLRDGGAECDLFHGHDQDQAMETPDGVISGSIVHLGVRGQWQRLIGGSRQRFVQVEGKAVDAHGELVAVFQHTVTARYQDMTQTDLLLEAGNAIGLFLSQGE